MLHPTGGGWFNRELKLLSIFFGLIFSFNFIPTNEVSALFVPTLSASVDQANLQVNGNQVINSHDQTKELQLRFNINTNNRTGYTTTISSSSENTSLVNSDSTSTSQISSISSNLNLSDFTTNTWGYKLGNAASYQPIPTLSAPASVIQTTAKTNGTDSNTINIGMKLNQSLESGSYSNTLIFSIVTNSYAGQAVMISGPDFNKRVGALDPNQTCHVDPVTG